MKKVISIRYFWAAALLTMVSFTLAQAQATRTWVSGVGDDANPCSRTAPCKTFAGAISKTAASGEINVLDPGGFGALTITKSITIDGSGGSIAGVLASGSNGIIINAAATDTIVLRNLDINGVGTGLNGIRFIAGGTLEVENCRIYDFTQRGIDFVPSGVSHLLVKDSTISKNPSNLSGGAIFIKPASGGSAIVSVDRTRMERSLFGLRAEDNSKVTVSNSEAINNVNNGFLAVSTSAAVELNLESCVAANNTGAFGVVASGAAATVRISNVTVTNNNTGLSAIGGGALISFGNNRVAGNTPGGNGSPTMTVGQQ
jgi:hypothetical protein